MLTPLNTYNPPNPQHDFLRVATDFKTFILPFTAAAFLAQLNLLLCSWSLLLKTRARLRHHSYLRYVGQRMRLLRAPWSTSPLAVQSVTQQVPAVAEALHSAAARAKAAVVRKRRARKRKQAQAKEQLQQQHYQEEEIKAEEQEK